MKNPIVVSLALAVGILILARFYHQIDIQSFLKDDGPVHTTTKTGQITLTPEEKQDQDFRTAIATSYCNVRRKKEDVAIENYNECVTKGIPYPLDIYKAMTGEQLTNNWDALATNEKLLVVQDVESAESKIIENHELNKSIKATNDYLQCQKDMQKEANPWLEERCPQTMDILKNISCRSTAMDSQEYKDLFHCESPY